MLNDSEEGSGKFTHTIFEKSVAMFAFDFGRADDGRDIAHEIKSRMLPSLAIALPVFLLGLIVYITFALVMAFSCNLCGLLGVVLCVALMSISSLFYIIGGQFLISKLWHLVPISGYSSGLDAGKFLVLPVIIGIISGAGASTRWYRTIFLEEMSKDYVRTARAKGLPESIVLFRHVLRNAMIDPHRCGSGDPVAVPWESNRRVIFWHTGTG